MYENTDFLKPVTDFNGYYIGVNLHFMMWKKYCLTATIILVYMLVIYNNFIQSKVDEMRPKKKKKMTKKIKYQ